MGKVSILSLVFMLMSLVVSYGIPVFLYIFMRKRKADPIPFFVGCAVFLIFALILEAFIHQIILGSSVGAVIRGNIWLYGIYGGLMAGLFEETGRYLAMRYALNKYMYKDVNALMYGAGHGGFECIALLGIAMTNNFIISILINSGMTDLITKSVPAEVLSQLTDAFDLLITTPSYHFILGACERVFAVIIHLSMSVLVWIAVKYRRTLFYLIAILLHAVVDCATVIVQDIAGSVLITEAVILILSLVLAWISAAVFRKNNDSGTGIFDILSKKNLRH